MNSSSSPTPRATSAPAGSGRRAAGPARPPRRRPPPAADAPQRDARCGSSTWSTRRRRVCRAGLVARVPIERERARGRAPRPGRPASLAAAGAAAASAAAPRRHTREGAAASAAPIAAPRSRAREPAARGREPTRGATMGRLRRLAAARARAGAGVRATVARFVDGPVHPLLRRPLQLREAALQVSYLARSRLRSYFCVRTT